MVVVVDGKGRPRFMMTLERRRARGYAMSIERQIRYNIRAHDRMARRYERVHGEIFNPVEQERLAAALGRVIGRAALRSRRRPLHALDAGSGTGNLTRHLLRAGCHVVAADVSSRSLSLLRERVSDPGSQTRLQTLVLNGRDLSNIASGTMDVVAAYSLLHHVPDYLALVREMIRVLAPGGVLYVDHEPAKCSWAPSQEYQRYLVEARPPLSSPERWRKFFVLENYIFKALRLRYPRATAEGDIHVWPDDHVEWDRVIVTLKEAGLVDIAYDEYLLYVRGWNRELHRRFSETCADTGVLVATKPAAF